MSRGLRSPEVTRKRRLAGSHLEVAVEGRKLAYAMHFTSYKAVAPVGGSDVTENASHDLRSPEEIRKSRHLTGSHLEVAVESQNSHMLCI